MFTIFICIVPFNCFSIAKNFIDHKYDNASLYTHSQPHLHSFEFYSILQIVLSNIQKNIVEAMRI